MARPRSRGKVLRIETQDPVSRWSRPSEKGSTHIIPSLKLGLVDKGNRSDL